MWKNGYIQLFVVGLAIFIGILCYADAIIITSSAGWFFVLLSIPSLMMIAIGYLGFYRFWKDLKEGKKQIDGCN